MCMRMQIKWCDDDDKKTIVMTLHTTQHNYTVFWDRKMSMSLLNCTHHTCVILLHTGANRMEPNGIGERTLLFTFTIKLCCFPFPFFWICCWAIRKVVSNRHCLLHNSFESERHFTRKSWMNVTRFVIQSSPPHTNW